MDDVTVTWWNPDATGPDEIRKEGKGMWELVDGGKRYLPGQIPETAVGLFKPEGAVTILDKPPAAETPPNYPSPAKGS